MYTIISGTNRKDSYSEKIAMTYEKILSSKGISARLLFLTDIDLHQRNDRFESMEIDVLIPTEKFIFILPEYNGSYPGILKLMIDNSSIKKCWWWKKALLTGVSTGRAGNLRGMDHLNGTLQYLKMFVHPNKLPISVVDTLFDENSVMNHTLTSNAIHEQLDEFIKF